MGKQIPVVNGSKRELVGSLRRQLQRFAAPRGSGDPQPIGSGCLALDRLLPAGGFLPGSLVECLGSPAGGGGTVALILARQAALEGGAIVVLDHERCFYPPAAAVLGIDLEQLLVVRAKQPRDQLWALDQSLRCPGVAAVWAPLEQVEQRDFRRLQLAAEEGGALGLLVRDQAARRQPSWSDIQLQIHPRAVEAQDPRMSRRLRVEITRCRQGRCGGVVEVEVDEVTGAMHSVSLPHETHTLHLAAQLAHPTAGRRSARA